MNASAIINELRVPHFSMSLCRIVAMLVVCGALKIDNFKLQGEFFSAYQDRDHCVFYLLEIICNSSQDVTPDFLSSWSIHWIKANNIFNKYVKM